MNIQQLRESLKLKWVKYFFQNRSWLVKMRIWGTYDGQRRPSSGFILATLSVLEPELDEILPLLLELNNNPDHIVTALGLNFNPEEQMHLIAEDADIIQQKILSETSTNGKVDFQPQTTLSSGELDSSQKGIENNGVVQHDIASRVSTQVQNQKKSLPLLSVVNKFETRSTQVSALAVIGKAESNSKPVPLLTVISKTENSSKPVRSLLLTSNIKRESQPGSSVIATSRVDSKPKLAQIPQQDLIDNVHSAPAKQKSRLTSWIDDFCQGVGWENDEAIYTRF
ncbi:DUF5331 domain-containing protein [Fischerella sp. NIES-3754]|uniref:DUF5331 domain-containing protein n=1 Tax=Fischerella sp. NIES-3754 TaxID=1752063 RepID=UPI00071F4C99|nr:DUF5331 domain-containing protein [Fischerella sp. NIES-3754]BAU08676.1 hypothetical protein FIS3754_46240 [Fischerella sp. NIES-3754]